MVSSVFARTPVLAQVRKLYMDFGALLRFQEAAHMRASEEFISNLLMTDRYADPRNLNRFGAQVYSQNGEDGIIAEIFHRIGTTDQSFVEIGVQNGLEANTTYLLSKGWSGTWIDANKRSLASAREHFRGPIAEGRLRLEPSFVTAANITDSLKRVGVESEVDLLSLDIDRNTYFVWEALDWLRARAVVVEYNAAILPQDEWTVAYSPNKQWNRTQYFGASLKAYERLGDRLGYRLVGCELAGVNAFFVRDDLVQNHFAGPYTAEHQYEPPRYWLTRRFGHRPCFSD